MATINDMADGVVDVVKGATLSLPFTIERIYVPIHELRELTQLTISVVPAAIEGELLTRGGLYMETYGIAVGIQQTIGFGKMSNEQIKAATDPLMTFAEQVKDLLTVNTPFLPTDPVARCVGYVHEVVYAAAHLDEKRVFTSVCTFQYKLGR